MKRTKHIVRTIIQYLIVTLPLSSVNAARIINDNIIEFSLSFQEQTTQFDFATNSYQTESKLVGINWYESFSRYFHAGLELGKIEMSQIDNMPLSAQFTTGEYAGLLLRFLPITQPTYSVTLNLNYRYNKTEAKSSNQETQFIWTETLLFSELHVRPTAHIGLLLAAEYQFLGGEQRDAGNIEQLTHFTRSQHTGYRFGLNFNTHHAGTIGLEWFTGFRTGSRLYLSRKF